MDAMILRSVLCWAAVFALTTSTWAADKPATKRAPKAPAKQVRKTAAKPPAKLAAQAPARTETLTCRDGTENRHARIGVVLLGGKVDSFAYYSKWKPRTCSIYLRRHGDMYSRWLDRANVTQVKLERGSFLIEHDKGAYRFVFRDIDRERYCGMDGTINGTLTIRKGSQHCLVSGIMEEGVPLGQAYAHLDAPAAATPASPPPQATAPGQVAQRPRRESPYSFQSGVLD